MSKPPRVNISIDFEDGFSVSQNDPLARRGSSASASGSFHRLTPEQFDALVGAFDVLRDIKTLTTDGRHTAPKTFRTADIYFGGMTLSLFADVPAVEVDAAQLSLY